MTDFSFSQQSKRQLFEETTVRISWRSKSETSDKIETDTSIGYSGAGIDFEYGSEN